jgi:next-to-BRCA1 protein 1
MLNVDDSRPSAECDVSKAVETNVVRHPVKPGEEFSFHVQMKAPKRQGCAISYWRLKAPDGTPFGHRLWCHINVTANPVAITSPSASQCPHLSLMKPSSSTEDKPYEYHSLDFSANRKLEREQAIRRLRAYRRRDMDCSRSYAARLYNPDTPKEDLKSLNEQHAANIEEMLKERFKNTKLSNAVQASSSQQPKEEPAVEPPAEIKQETPSIAVEQVPTNAAEVESVPAIAEPSTEIKAEPAVAEPEVKAEDDIFEDAESISLSDDEESGFHTDDEYDILNASDEEEIKA